jgi:FkbM family methyltransferase
MSISNKINCLLKGYREVHLAGVKIRVPLKNDTKFWDSVDANEWEMDTLSLYSEYLQSGTHYCDIGAWVGPTVIFAHHLGARVTCFEPDIYAYEKLLANLRLNNLFDVRCFNLALGSSNGFREMGAMISSLGKSSTSFLGTKSLHKISVPCLKWDAVIDLFSLPKFDFIKIDIEGGEVELIPEMLGYFSEFSPMVLLSCHWNFLNEIEKSKLKSNIDSLKAIYKKVFMTHVNSIEEFDIKIHSYPAQLFFKNQ